MNIIHLTVLFFLSAICSAAKPSFMPSQKDPEGWLWYKELPKAQKSKLAIPKKVKDPVKEVEKVKKAFEVASARAMLNPTFKNVQLAQHLQREIIEKATAFQKMWSWVTMLDASNYDPKSHGNRVHRELLQEEENQLLQHNLTEMAKTYGLFFFFKESCPYCHAFAPIVKQFAKDYGFEVKAVSYDGGALEDFPSASLDNGAVRKLNPQLIFPALLLVNPDSGDVVPLSWGMNARSVLDQQANLIYTNLIQEGTEEDEK